MIDLVQYHTHDILTFEHIQSVHDCTVIYPNYTVVFGRLKDSERLLHYEVTALASDIRELIAMDKVKDGTAFEIPL